jgi:hypothetical protein
LPTDGVRSRRIAARQSSHGGDKRTGSKRIASTAAEAKQNHERSASAESTVPG